MSYYKTLDSLLQISTNKYIPKCLAEMILSYCTYPSVSFYEWLKNNLTKEIKNELSINVSLVTPSRISGNYCTREYILNEERYKPKDGERVYYSLISKVYDSWRFKVDDYNSYHYFVFSYFENVNIPAHLESSLGARRELFGLMQLYMNTYPEIRLSIKIYTAETLEQLYTYNLKIYHITESAIKILDSNDCDFKFITYEQFVNDFKSPNKITDLKFPDKINSVSDSIGDNIYYIGDIDYFGGLYCISKTSDGIWKLCRYVENYSSTYNSLTAAIENTCGIYKFIRWQYKLLLCLSN